MNKSFKVVFSKARSALMVVNEATSSIQAKGTKTVIAAAAAAMIAGGAVAATTSIVKDAATLKDGTAYNSYTSDKASKTDNDFGALYVDGRGATTAVSGSAVNLSFTNNTSSGKAGALALDEASLTLRDAQFSNNSAAGWGGAVRLWGTSASRSALELKTTRDLTYAGNKAGQGKTAEKDGSTALGARYEDMGGFAHLQGNSTLTLNAAANTTLTIGETGAAKTAGLDSITTSYGGNTLEINGAGTVNLNGSLEGFVGAINVSGGTVNMATGFGSIDNETQSNVNSQTANASGAKAGDVRSVLTVQSGATVNMGALTINRSTTSGAGTKLAVKKDGKLYVESITLGTKEYKDKYQKSSTEKLASGSLKTSGHGAVDVASGAVAEVKKDVTVAADTTFDKTGSGAFTVLGTLKTVAAVSGGAAAGVFNVSGGSVDVNKVTNDGTTNVASGASFSVTGTGSVNSGTISIVGTTGISQSTASTAGSLTVAKGADFVNTGFISGSAKTESNKTTYTADNTGDVFIAGTFTNYGTVDGKTVNGYIGANSLTVEEGGVLNTKITDSYAVHKTTVKGTFNLTELNSSVSDKATDPKDQLVLADEMTLDGGLMTLNGQEFTGNVKLGSSSNKPAKFVVKGARDYRASQITFLPKGQGSEGSTLTLDKDYEGTYTVGTLDAAGADSVKVNGGALNVDTKLTTKVNGNTANVHVGKDGTLALTKTAIGLTVATSGETETHAVAGTFKGVENAGRVLVTGLDGMTVKAGTLTMIKDAIVKTNTGFIDFGKLAVDAKTVSGYDSTANTLTASGAATLDGMHLDQFKNTTVTDVSAPNTLNGSFGAVKLASGTASFTVADAKQVYLNNSGNLVVDKDGKLADVAVGNRSSFVTTGQNAVVGGVTGASGSFVVESGSLEAKGDVNVADLTVTGALTVYEKAAVPASGSPAAQPAQKYTVTATNLTVEQGGVLNVLHDVTLESGAGALADVDGTMNVKGVLSANDRTINVGSDNSTGVLTVGTLKNATVFADPAWNNGMEAAQVAVKTLDSTAKVEAGRNSIVAVGTTDITKAQAALAQTGLKLGEVTKGSVGVVNAVAYVTAEPTVTAGVTDYNGTTVGGKVLVSGATQAAGSHGAAITSITHGLDVKKDTLAIIDASGFDKSGAIAVFSNSINIDDGATVYLSNLKNGDKLNLTTATRTISGNANIVFAGDLLMNFEAVKDAAGNETSVYQMSMVDRAELAKMGAVAGLGAAYGMFAEGVDNNSSSAQFNKWLYTSTTSPMNDGTKEGNFVALQTAAKDVASLGATTGVQTMTMDAVNQMGETVADRVSLLTQRATGLNNPRLKARGFLTRCRLFRNSQGF